MKILLDENIPLKFRLDFPYSYEVFTVKFMGWLGKKNGELLGLAVLNDFDVLITLDQHIPAQQHLTKFPIAILQLKSPTSQYEDVTQFLVKTLELLWELKSRPAPGVYKIEL